MPNNIFPNPPVKHRLSDKLSAANSMFRYAAVAALLIALAPLSHGQPSERGEWLTLNPDALEGIGDIDYTSDRLVVSSVYTDKILFYEGYNIVLSIQSCRGPWEIDIDRNRNILYSACSWDDKILRYNITTGDIMFRPVDGTPVDVIAEGGKVFILFEDGGIYEYKESTDSLYFIYNSNVDFHYIDDRVQTSRYKWVPSNFSYSKPHNILIFHDEFYNGARWERHLVGLRLSDKHEIFRIPEIQSFELSENGRYVGFYKDNNLYTTTGIGRIDLSTNNVEEVNANVSGFYYPYFKISASGRYIYYLVLGVGNKIMDFSTGENRTMGIDNNSTKWACFLQNEDMLAVGLNGSAFLYDMQARTYEYTNETGIGNSIYTCIEDQNRVIAAHPGFEEIYAYRLSSGSLGRSDNLAASENDPDGLADTVLFPSRGIGVSVSSITNTLVFFNYLNKEVVQIEQVGYTKLLQTGYYYADVDNNKFYIIEDARDLNNHDTILEYDIGESSITRREIPMHNRVWGFVVTDDVPRRIMYKSNYYADHGWAAVVADMNGNVINHRFYSCSSPEKQSSYPIPFTTNTAIMADCSVLVRWNYMTSEVQYSSLGGSNQFITSVNDSTFVLGGFLNPKRIISYNGTSFNTIAIYDIYHDTSVDLLASNKDSDYAFFYELGVGQAVLQKHDLATGEHETLYVTTQPNHIHRRDINDTYTVIEDKPYIPTVPRLPNSDPRHQYGMIVGDQWMHFAGNIIDVDYDETRNLMILTTGAPDGFYISQPLTTSNEYDGGGGIPNSTLSIYPNPSRGDLYLEFYDANNISATAEFSIYNSLGRLVLSSQIRSGMNILDTRRLSSGTYIAIARAGDKVLSQKFTVAR